MHKDIPALSSRRFVALLRRHGCRFVRQRGTSHAVHEREVGGMTFRAPVIMAKKELSSQYIKLVLGQLGFTDEEIKQMI